MAIITILISWVMDTIRDSIQFGKSGRDMKELWHVCKGLSYLLPYGYIAYIKGIPLWLCLVLIVTGYIIHEVGYRVLTYYEVWKLDRKFECKYIRWIMLINNNNR